MGRCRLPAAERKGLRSLHFVLRNQNQMREQQRTGGKWTNDPKASGLIDVYFLREARAIGGIVNLAFDVDTGVQTE